MKSWTKKEIKMSDIRYIVNVEAVIYRDDQYLLIKRSDKEEHAPGILSNAGGKVEIKNPQKEVLEKTIIREIKEEVDIELKSPFHYLESKSFYLDKKELIIDIIFLCEYKSGQAKCKDKEEVDQVYWLSYKEIMANKEIEDWLKNTIAKAEKFRKK
ncbi:MAG TPA: NUDIX domain-containing protein [Halanaerobiales bacterium]|nr:NUDIX domain-containing protein [Halanaerobiales bacterium]